MRRNPLLRILIILQGLGMIVGVTLAMYEIRSIVWSGPIFALGGIVIAVASYRLGLLRGFYVGLAAPTLAVLCFVLIYGLEWSPEEASRPIPSLLAFAAMFYIPAGIHAWTEARALAPAPRRRPLQFTIASLLWTTLATAVFLSVVRTRQQPLIALLTLAGYGAITFYVVTRFRRGRELFAVSEDPADDDSRQAR